MEKEAQHVAMEQSIEALEQASLSATGEHGCQSIMAIVRIFPFCDHFYVYIGSLIL